MNLEEIAKVRSLPYQCWTKGMLLHEHKRLSARCGSLLSSIQVNDYSEPAERRRKNLKKMTEEIPLIEKVIYQRMSF